MAGALAERVFVDKLTGVGFVGIDVHERRPFMLDDIVCYPLFTPDLIELMKDLLDEDAQVALAVTLSARKPA